MLQFDHYTQHLVMTFILLRLVFLALDRLFCFFFVFFLISQNGKCDGKCNPTQIKKSLTRVFYVFAFLVFHINPVSLRLASLCLAKSSITFSVNLD